MCVCVRRGRAPPAASPPLPRPAPAPRPGGERVSGSHEPPARQPGPGPPPPPPSPPPAATTGRPPARLLRPPPPPPLRCVALPAPRAREGAAEEPPPAPGPRPSRPGPRHGALAAAASRAARLGRCGRPRRAAPAGTMSPLLRRLLLAVLLQLAPAQVRASATSRPRAVPSLKVGGSGKTRGSWGSTGASRELSPGIPREESLLARPPDSGATPPPHPVPWAQPGAGPPRCLADEVRRPLCPFLIWSLEN